MAIPSGRDKGESGRSELQTNRLPTEDGGDDQAAGRPAVQADKVSILLYSATSCNKHIWGLNFMQR